MATKEQIVNAIKEAVGNTAYGEYLVQDAEEHAGETGKYAQNMVDRLHESIGLLAAYQRIHAAAGEEAKATTEEEKIAIAKKALKAVEGLE